MLIIHISIFYLRYLGDCSVFLCQCDLLHLTCQLNIV